MMRQALTLLLAVSFVLLPTALAHSDVTVGRWGPETLSQDTPEGEDCRAFEDCHELRGTALNDHDIREGKAAAEEEIGSGFTMEAKLDVFARMSGPTKWMMCSYEEDGTENHCRFGKTAKFKTSDTVKMFVERDTAFIRVVLLEDLINHPEISQPIYYLHVTTNHSH